MSRNKTIDTPAKQETMHDDNADFLSQLDAIFNDFNDLGKLYDEIDSEETDQDEVDFNEEE